MSQAMFPTAHDLLDQAKAQEIARHEPMHTTMFDRPMLSAEQVDTEWQASKKELVDQAAIDLHAAYGDDIARFGPNGLQQVSRTTVANGPALGTLAALTIALGAEVDRLSIAAVGALALGTLVHDFTLRGHYNKSVASFDQFRNEITSAQHPHDAMNAIEGYNARIRQAKGPLRDFKTVAAGTVTAVVSIGAMAASVVSSMTPVEIMAASAVAATSAGLVFGESSTDHAQEVMASKASNQGAGFADKLNRWRVPPRPETGPQVDQAPAKVPGMGS